MNLRRRDVLRAGAAAGGAALLAGCDASSAWNLLARQLEPAPASVELPADPGIDPAVHALNRLTFGARPGDLDAVRKLGVDGWIEQQLDPGAIDDLACDLRARRFESLHASAGDIFEFKKPVVEAELFRHTMLRAVYSRRQLFEVMAAFWTDHLNICTGKGDCAWLKTVDDRDVVRRHALGRFRDLLRASALSPAMLVYLDGQANRKAQGAEGPNENYARELLELHTLGVHGGYTQKDVMEAARCLTGWSVAKGWNRGKVLFNADLHDDGAKKVLGVVIPPGQGEKDLDQLLDVVARHPSTSMFIATKLCRRFVADDPPAALVGRVAAAFRESDGEIRPTLRVLVESGEFRAARGTRLKRPFHFVASALRALDADTDGGAALHAWLLRMGHAPFQYPTPDGFPEEPAPWLGTLLWRWNFAADLASNRIHGTRVAPGAAPALLLGRPPREDESAALRQAASEESRVALLLSSPGFQRY